MCAEKEVVKKPLGVLIGATLLDIGFCGTWARSEAKASRHELDSKNQNNTTFLKRVERRESTFRVSVAFLFCWLYSIGYPVSQPHQREHSSSATFRQG